MTILTINSGSSSVKFALFDLVRGEVPKLIGKIERIGLAGGTFRVRGTTGASLLDQTRDLPDHAAAFEELFAWLTNQPDARQLDAVGHRIVHGGTRFIKPHRINDEMIASLRQLVALAPDHLPHQVGAIEATSRAYPKLAQVACFDTAFHRQMPAPAQTYALPKSLRDEGLIRYGFHGLSYEFISQELRKVAPASADGRVILAHLGNGASMAAMRGGVSVDTTMGFTPTGGLVMSTRSGDLDPGVVLHLLDQKGMTVTDVRELLNKKAGLLGVSGISSDVKDLLAKEASDRAAAEAIELFCYQAKKFVASLAAVFGGLDTLIFTAGIGENAPAIRRRICDGLAFLGIELDDRRNNANEALISTDRSLVAVRVMKTNEELMIARHTANLIADAVSPTRKRGM
jgi:acetate kinase